MDMVLLPPLRQTLWGRLAVANFFLGGAGAGAYLVAAALSDFPAAPPVGRAGILGPLLVLAGFLSVAVEAGHPLRGPRVFLRLSTSWMSRESWAGGAFVTLAALDLLRPWAGWRIGAALAAVAFVLAQGWVLRHCRGIMAWSVPLLPPVFLASALASGAAVLGVAAPLWPAGGARLAAATAAVVLLSALAWIAYGAWPRVRAFGRAGAGLRETATGLGVFFVGHALPLFLLALAFGSPAFAVAGLALAGVAGLAGQLQAKAWLILRAGELRPITLDRLQLKIPGPAEPLRTGERAR